MHVFENAADQAVVQFTFANGWTLSLVKRYAGDVMDVMACCFPANAKGNTRLMELLGDELSSEEITTLMQQVAARKKPARTAAGGRLQVAS